MEQRPLDFSPRKICGMDDPVGRMTTFPAEVKATVFLREAGSHFNEISQPVGAFTHHDPYRILVGQSHSCRQGVTHVKIKRIDLRHDRGNTSLGQVSVGFCLFLFRDDGDRAMPGDLEGVG